MSSLQKKTRSFLTLSNINRTKKTRFFDVGKALKFVVSFSKQ